MEWDAEDQPSDDTLGFLPFLGGLGDILGWEDGGQGWIRTSVRKPGQIYSLLPLTTRPPVLGARFGKRSNGETRDRKSVVEGKSVSVRVDLGGRRIIKKKKKKTK